jgi:hypothetical protein
MTRTAKTHRNPFARLRAASAAGLVIVVASAAWTLGLGAPTAAEQTWRASARCAATGALGRAMSARSADEALAAAVRVCAMAGGEAAACRATATLEG